MLVRLEYREWLMVGRGIAALFACIVAGSIVVETQLNQLTYWLDFIQVFNLRQVAAGAYQVYILGTEYSFQAAWQVGTIYIDGKWIDVTLLGVGVTIPTQVSIDGSLVLAFVQTTWQQAIEYAFVGKRHFSDCWADAAPFLRAFLHQVANHIK